MYVQTAYLGFYNFNLISFVVGFFFVICLMFVLEREKERAGEQGMVREGDTETKAGGIEPDAGLEPMKLEIMKLNA